MLKIAFSMVLGFSPRKEQQPVIRRTITESCSMQQLLFATVYIFHKLSCGLYLSLVQAVSTLVNYRNTTLTKPVVYSQIVL